MAVVFEWGDPLRVFAKFEMFVGGQFEIMQIKSMNEFGVVNVKWLEYDDEDDDRYNVQDLLGMQLREHVY